MRNAHTGRLNDAVRPGVAKPLQLPGHVVHHRRLLTDLVQQGLHLSAPAMTSMRCSDRQFATLPLDIDSAVADQWNEQNVLMLAPALPPWRCQTFCCSMRN